jgi:outer membrane receptor protein involved in Fe transport
LWTVPAFLSLDFGVAYGVKISQKARLNFNVRVRNLTNRLNYLGTYNTRASFHPPRLLTCTTTLAW